MPDLTQPRKQGLLFVRSVLGRGLPEVAQSGLQRSSCVLRRGTIYHFCNRHERTQEHLNASVAVREQSGGITKVVRCRSNLNRHISSLLRILAAAMTKVSATEATNSTESLCLTQSSHNTCACCTAWVRCGQSRS